MSINENLNQNSVFTKKVESNPDICTNCYRRLSYKLYPHDELPDCVTAKKEYTENTDFAYFDDDVDSGRPSVHRAYCECGFVDNGKIRPLDKNQLMKIAQRVVKRLDEQDIDIDKDAFFDVVREEKSNPKSQFNEEAILESAVETAIILEQE